ncbi:MAG: hypothetical protein ACR2K1_15475 [Saprospiraceae bacterium]
MLQRRTRAPFPLGQILFVALLLALILYYWRTNRPNQPPAGKADNTEAQPHR